MKTEKEKILSGEMYSPFVAGLSENRARLGDLIHQYNLLTPSETDGKQTLARTILDATEEKNFTVEQSFYCDYVHKIHIGNNFFSNFNCAISAIGLVSIGVDILFSSAKKDDLEYAKPIAIGNNAWIAGNVVILPGVTTGDNTIIGAGNVVTKNIPANVIAVGNSCKVIREI